MSLARLLTCIWTAACNQTLNQFGFHYRFYTDATKQRQLTFDEVCGQHHTMLQPDEPGSPPQACPILHMFYDRYYEPYKGRSYAIVVKTLKGQDETFLVEGAGSLIEHVKALIQRSTGVIMDQQLLIFAGQPLSDGRTLSDYVIREGSVLHLIYRCRGD
jgi:hypothetical protein